MAIMQTNRSPNPRPQNATPGPMLMRFFQKVRNHPVASVVMLMLMMFFMVGFVYFLGNVISLGPIAIAGVVGWFIFISIYLYFIETAGQNGE